MRVYDAEKLLDDAVKQALPEHAEALLLAIKEYVAAKCDDMRYQINRTGDWDPGY